LTREGERKKGGGAGERERELRGGEGKWGRVLKRGGKRVGGKEEWG